MAVVFWTCVVFVVYSYVGYGIALALMSRVRNRPVRRAPITPSVSFIIAAHNEAKRITEKIENTLRQDYPSDRFEIIVASDGSTDATDEIVRSYADRRVRLIRPDQRRGKEYAQRTAIAAARGEVLVFSDVATRLDPDGVRQIVMSFDDPSVGCVSSVDRMIGSDGRPSGEGGYVRYEMQLRALESRVGSLVGLSGSFFAARREVCTPWPVDIPSDFTTVLNAVTRGLRGVSDGNAIGYYTDLADTSKEYSRKVRTVVRGISALLTHRALLNPFRSDCLPGSWRATNCSDGLCRSQWLAHCSRTCGWRPTPTSIACWPVFIWPGTASPCWRCAGRRQCCGYGGRWVLCC
jgi:glycosyltransferase involved in cell wall biosynthesis